MNSEDTGKRAIDWTVLCLLHQRLRKDSFPEVVDSNIRIDARRRTETPGPPGAKFLVMWEDGTQQVVYGTREIYPLELGFVDSLFGKKKEGAKWHRSSAGSFQSNPSRWRRGRYMETESGRVAFVRREN